MAARTHHHRPLRLLCFKCLDYWARLPVPTDNWPYCDREDDIAECRRCEGLPVSAVSEHEDTYLCFACQARHVPGTLARMGYPAEANARVIPWAMRVSCPAARRN